VGGGKIRGCVWEDMGRGGGREMLSFECCTGKSGKFRWASEEKRVFDERGVNRYLGHWGFLQKTGLDGERVVVNRPNKGVSIGGGSASSECRKKKRLGKVKAGTRKSASKNSLTKKETQKKTQ